MSAYALSLSRAQPFHGVVLEGPRLACSSTTPSRRQRRACNGLEAPYAARTRVRYRTSTSRIHAYIGAIGQSDRPSVAKFAEVARPSELRGRVAKYWADKPSYALVFNQAQILHRLTIDININSYPGC
eukprot:6184033-Pleurochrysis_carterae.AAC.2